MQHRCILRMRLQRSAQPRDRTRSVAPIELARGQKLQCLGVRGELAEQARIRLLGQREVAALQRRLRLRAAVGGGGLRPVVHRRRHGRSVPDR